MVLPVDDARNDTRLVVDEDVGLAQVLMHQGAAKRAFRQGGDDTGDVLLELSEQFLRVARFHGECSIVRDLEEVGDVVLKAVVHSIGETSGRSADARNYGEGVLDRSC